MTDGNATPPNHKPPLIVDMDCTVLCSDTLMEGIAAGLFQRPFSTLGRLAMAPLSRPALKAWVFKNIVVDYEAIPLNEPLVDYLRSEKASGRAIHLVSAADQGVVESVARRFDIFDSAIGTTGKINLKGRRKLDLIQEKFGGNFVYAGDSAPDMRVWNGASGAIYAGTNSSIARQLAKGRTGLEAEFTRQAAGLGTWLKALRPHQWAKNLLLFLPLILSHSYRDIDAVTHAALAFLIIGVAASGTYLINDLSDLGSDRRHRSKKNRPLASARLPIAQALIVAPLMILGALAAAIALSPAFAAALSAYLVLTVWYSLRLKRIPMLDVFVLGGLYTLRLIMGTAVIGVSYSIWLLTFAMFFFFSLSLAKRHVEVAVSGATPKQLIRGRGYYPEDAPLTLSLGIGAAAASVLILVLYLVDEAYEATIYQSPTYLAGIPIILAFWTSRIWLLAHRGQLDDDPVSFAIRDPLSIVLGVGVAALLVAAVVL